MIRLGSTLFMALIGATSICSSAAMAENCRPPCGNVEGGVRGSSVIPGPDDLTKLGQNFNLQDTQTLNLTGNQSQLIQLNFGFQIGATTYKSLFVNENGAISFGSPIGVSYAAAGPAPSAFQPVASLTELGVPVIAPFYADLIANPNQTQDFIGNVVVQYGTADPYPDGGAYSRSDFQNAVRISWYGLTNGGSVNPGDQVFAQLLLAGDNRGTSSFAFRYGPPDQPGEDADGSIAGFALGEDNFQFTGPYVGDIPTYFEFNNGRLAGPLSQSAVPEPASWGMMLIGFAAVGLAFRARRRDRMVMRLA